MRHTVTATLRREVEAFALRFSCEDCCHRRESEGGLACSLEFPAELRRDSLDDASLAFCKSFELA